MWAWRLLVLLEIATRIWQTRQTNADALGVGSKKFLISAWRRVVVLIAEALAAGVGGGGG